MFCGGQLLGLYAQAHELVDKGSTRLLVGFSLLPGLVDELDGVVILDDDAGDAAALDCVGHFVDGKWLLGSGVLIETDVKHHANRHEQQKIDDERLGSILNSRIPPNSLTQGIIPIRPPSRTVRRRTFIRVSNSAGRRSRVPSAPPGQRRQRQPVQAPTTPTKCLMVHSRRPSDLPLDDGRGLCHAADSVH